MKRRFNDINVTPFVDVVLVLLIIFMITAPVMFHGFNINLPKAETEELPPPERYSVIVVDKDMNVFIEGEKVNLGEIPEKIGKGKSVYIKADESVPYGFIMKILSSLKKAEITDVGLVTAPPEKHEQ